MLAEADFAVRLPESLSDLEAAPAPLRRHHRLPLPAPFGIQPGGRLALFGFGASAHLAAQVALHWRCEVYAFTREEVHRRLALEIWGDVGGPRPGTTPLPMDAAVIFAPAGAVVPRPSSTLRPAPRSRSTPST